MHGESRPNTSTSNLYILRHCRQQFCHYLDFASSPIILTSLHHQFIANSPEPATILYWMPTYYRIYSQFVDTTVIKSAVILTSLRLGIGSTSWWFRSWVGSNASCWEVWTWHEPWAKNALWETDGYGSMVCGLCKWWPFHHTIFGPHTLNRLITISPWTWHELCEWPHESQMDIVTSFLRGFSLWLLWLRRFLTWVRMHRVMNRFTFLPTSAKDVTYVSTRIALSTPLIMTPWTTDHHTMHSNPSEEPSQPEQPKGETSQERSNYIHLTLMWSLTKFVPCPRWNGNKTVQSMWPEYGVMEWSSLT
jgi:hypothetical protein